MEISKSFNPISWLRNRFESKSVPNRKIEASAGKGIYRAIGTISYTGEKNLGEMGPIKEYFLDYAALRARSWQLLIENDVFQTVLGKYTTWMIGKGLKLQSEPNERILSSNNVRVDVNEFSEQVEALFDIYAQSRESDFSKMGSLNIIEGEAHKNSMHGDVLVILRFDKELNEVTTQLIDGAHIISPQGYGSDNFPQPLDNGNFIVNGIELSPTGEHVAYYVRKGGEMTFSWEVDRIPARGKKSGLIMAFLVYGDKYRLDNHRGIPVLAGVLETAKKLERYKEAVVGSAEERQKIVMQIVHKEFSTGENVYANQTVKAYDTDRYSDNIPEDSYGNALADRIGISTNKQSFNMPLGAELKAVESKNELYFKDFYEVNIMLFCAAVQIPFEVAMSKYDSNYSASRAAIKDWENTLLVKRNIWAQQFRKPIYAFWLEVKILTGMINAPGYMLAKTRKNWYVIEAYRNARFIGPPVPHIDPYKEVQAERLKLGAAGVDYPLTTGEAATESLNGGNADANVKQFAEELKESKKLGIKVDPVPVAGGAPAGKSAKKKLVKKKPA
jgi:capsid protein